MRQRQVEHESIDYAKKPLDEPTIRSLVARAGSVAAILNTRHATVKANGWAAKPPSVAEFAKAAAQEPNLLRRPLLLVDDRLIIGFDEAAYKKL